MPSREGKTEPEEKDSPASPILAHVAGTQVLRSRVVHSVKE